MRIAGGVETEMGPAGFGETAASARDIARQVMGAATNSLTHLPGAGSDIFIPAGGRLMIDNGQHVEYSTPEALTPAGMVIAVRAGEQILTDLIREIPDAFLARTNHCYLTGATYGSHENYCIHGSINVMHRHLMAHLITRPIYTGAGGLDPGHPGVSFILSPRSTHFVHTRGALARSLMSHRDEPLADRFKRLHITCGETLALDRALFLRLGTTALLIMLIESGRLDARRIPRLQQPRTALSRIIRDPTLTKPLRLHGTEYATSLEIQRTLLELAEEAAVPGATGDAPPPWCAQVLTEWRRTLDTLADDPSNAVVDWAVKRRAFDDQIERSELTPDELRRGNRAIRAAERIRAATEGHTLFDVVTRTGADAELIRRVRALRERLVRLDFFFTTLPYGIISEFAGDLDDRVEGVTAEAVRHAMHCPPEPSRALLRSRYIRRLNRDRRRYQAGWKAIRDRRDHKVLRMRDPFVQDAQWQPDASMERLRRTEDPLTLLSDAYNRGAYGGLRHLLSALLPDVDVPSNSDFLPYFAWCSARTGDIAAAERAVVVYRREGGPQELAGMYCAIYRFRALSPSPRIWPWIRRADRLARDQWTHSGYVSYLGHRGTALRHAGYVDDAIETLRRSLEVPVTAPNHLRLVARNRCDLAECLRLRGASGEAAQQLATALEVFTTHGFEGEYAEHYLLAKARLEPEAPGTLRDLERARRLLHNSGHQVGVVRASLLMARLTRDPDALRRIERVILRRRGLVADLRTSRTLRRILARWDRWAGGYAPNARDPFWGI